MLTTRQKYVLSTFSDIYDWDEFHLIDYGHSGDGPIRIVQEPHFFFSSNRILDPSEARFYDIRNTRIPVLFHTDNEDLVIVKNGIYEITFDLISACFYMLSGWQEYHSDVRDRHGRYPYKESLQYHFNCVELPVVNYYFSVLADVLTQVTLKRITPKSKSGERMSLFLSHDIDQCTSGWKEEMLFALARFNIFNASKIIINRVLGADPWWTFESILHLEKANNTTSVFFFLPSQEKVGSIEQADYCFDDPKILKVFDSIQKAGSKVMLHGSVGSQSSLALLNQNLSKFDPGTIVNRFHYLMWDSKVTPSILDDSAIRTDSTLGFAEHIGFRNGICHPFKLYDLSRNKVTEVEEIPLMIMDTTLYNKQYMGLDVKQVSKPIATILSQVVQFNGVASVLWHNNYFFEGKYEGWGKVYEELVKLIRLDHSKS